MMYMADNDAVNMKRVRTTVTFDPDVARVLERLQRERGEGLSEVVNALVREGTSEHAQRPRFVQTTSDMGEFLIPVDNVGEALAYLDEEKDREIFG